MMLWRCLTRGSEQGQILVGQNLVEPGLRRRPNADSWITSACYSCRKPLLPPALSPRKPALGSGPWRCGRARHGRLVCCHVCVWTVPAILFRWRGAIRSQELPSLKFCSRRPRQLRRSQRFPAVVERGRQLRQPYPRWGREKLRVLFGAEGRAALGEDDRPHRGAHAPSGTSDPAAAVRSARRCRSVRSYAIRTPHLCGRSLGTWSKWIPSMCSRCSGACSSSSPPVRSPPAGMFSKPIARLSVGRRPAASIRCPPGAVPDLGDSGLRRERICCRLQAGLPAARHLLVRLAPVF